MSKAKLLFGLAREANRFVGRFTGRRSGQYADRPAGKVKKFIRRQDDLVRRPGRAHGYETPKGKPPRTRAQGHAVYKKSLGVPGFKTRAHHEFLELQASNRTGALLGGAGIGVHGVMETHRINKKTSSLKKRSATLDRSTRAIKNSTAAKAKRRSHMDYLLKGAFGTSGGIDHSAPTTSFKKTRPKLKPKDPPYKKPVW